jgi:EAL domain-containing protein (putative c-di-GMP-specific phosphodiesterase class I)
VHSEDDARLLARRIDTAFDTPFALDGVTIPMTASVGMAFAGLDEDVSADLVYNADVAMYQAKRQGGGRHQLFDLRDGILAGDLRKLEADLRAALRADELEVVYQPIVRTADGSIIGAEALLRWSHREQGPVAPLSIVAVAEQGGFITELGAWVLERSCRDWKQWQHAHPGTPLLVAVNVSARQLMTHDFYATVASVLDRTAMDAAALILEITESVFIEDSTRATTVINDLKALTLQLALDDFGTGFSSLEYLRRLPIDIVKIDRCFVADIGDSPSGAAIVEAVTNLAHALDLTVTAEGVETAQQHDGIAAIGCEHAQGNFYGAPLSGAAFAMQLDSLLLPGKEGSIVGDGLASLLPHRTDQGAPLQTLRSRCSRRTVL